MAEDVGWLWPVLVGRWGNPTEHQDRVNASLIGTENVGVQLVTDHHQSPIGMSLFSRVKDRGVRLAETGELIVPAGVASTQACFEEQCDRAPGITKLTISFGVCLLYTSPSPRDRG